MIDAARGLGEFGAALVSLILLNAMLFAAGWLTYLSIRGRVAAWPALARRPATVILFCLYLHAAGVLLYPSAEATLKLSCRSAGDFMACVEGDD